MMEKDGYAKTAMMVCSGTTTQRNVFSVINILIIALAVMIEIHVIYAILESLFLASVIKTIYMDAE